MRSVNTFWKGGWPWFSIFACCTLFASPFALAARKTCPDFVDINHADVSQLRCLRGVGEKRAAAVVIFRETHGPYPGPASLAAVVGPKMAQRLRERVVVNVPADPAPR